MNLQQLRAFLTALYIDPDVIDVVLYVVYENEEGVQLIRKADIDVQTRLELKTMFLESIDLKFLSNEDLSYMPLTDGDNRRNAAFYYDLDGFPEGLTVLQTIYEDEDQPQFSFNNDDFAHIKAFVISIGSEDHKALLYKKHHHLSLIHAHRAFGIRISNHRFVRVREDIIKLSPNFDFLFIDGHLIVNSLKTLESSFGFDTLIRNQATTSITAIEGLMLLEDMAPLLEMAQDIRQAKKIMRIKPNSPVMQRSAAEITDFIKNHPKIGRKFKLNDDGTRLKLDTQVSRKLFIKVMNDDFLNSKLTLAEYDSLAKDYLPEDDQ